MKRLARTLSLALFLALGAACGSAVEMQHVHPGYLPLKEDAVKRVAVVAWTPAQPAGLSRLAADVVTEFVNLKKNYLVYTHGPATSGWSQACTEKTEAVLELRLLEYEQDKEDAEVWLHATFGLYRCADGALLWWTDADDDYDSDNEDLNEMRNVFGKRYGSVADDFATPLFELIKDALEELPNPELTDDEVLERIELS